MRLGRPLVISMRPKNWGTFAVDVCAEEMYGDSAFALLSGHRQPIYVVLSPNTEFVKASRIFAILNWGLRHSDELLVVEGSFLGRWNLAAFQKKTLETATEEARVRSQKFRERIYRVIEAHKWWPNVTLFDYEQAISSPAYQETLGRIASFADRSRDFSRALANERDSFLSSRKNPPPPNESVHLLTNYLLEEIAIFLFINLQGHHVEIYPGPELPILREIVEGAFPEFPVSTSNRGQIPICVRRMKRTEHAKRTNK